MGYKNWAAGDPLLAADVMSYLMNQSVISCTSSTRPSLSVEGVLIYETDTDRFYVYNGGWVQFGGSGAWQSWTPTITQSGTVTYSATYARYQRTGRVIHAEALLAVTGTGTSSNNVTVSLPVTPATLGNMVAGSGVIYDTSAGFNFPGIAVLTGTSSVGFIPSSSSASSAFLGAGVFTAALGSGDVVSFSVTYEAAS